MKATIYIPDDQAKIYEDAKEKLGESISKTFLKCLERELEAARMKTDRIVVEVYDAETGRVTKKAFHGRFIVGDEGHPEAFYYDPTRSAIQRVYDGFAVALTKGGRLVVLEFDGEQNVISFGPERVDGSLGFGDFEEFKAEYYPESLTAAVANEMGVEHVEELDI